MDSRPRLHEGRPFARTGEGVMGGFRTAPKGENVIGDVFTPHPNLPPQGEGTITRLQEDADEGGGQTQKQQEAENVGNGGHEHRR